jgi:hypothetical protein
MIADLQIGLLFDGVGIFALLSQEQYELTAGISGQQAQQHHDGRKILQSHKK